MEGDICDQELIQKVLVDVDYVFHEAAQAGVRISMDEPLKSHQVNATGTLILLKAAINADVRKMIYASSSSVYGNPKYLPLDETHPTNPISPYGVSKLTAENYCRVFSEIYDFKTVSLRYFTVYGPRMRPDLAISIFSKASLSNEPIVIFGEGDKTRDFTYVDDVVEANILAMRCGAGPYNIGGGHKISIKKLADKIQEINKSNSDIVYMDSVKGDMEHTLANVEKAQIDLGWTPKTTVDEGLREYMRWLLKFQ